MPNRREPEASAAGGPLSSKLIVVALGASAGGLESFVGFLDAVPKNCRMAFILVQHLAPQAGNLLGELLAKHTSLPVLLAESGMAVRPGHCYVLPPGKYGAVEHGVLQLSPSPAEPGMRLPFDFLLRSLAAEYGARAACVVLSGNGSDGSAGLKALAEQGGLVLAQRPEEAEYDGMPRSAVATGLVGGILSVAEMPAALLAFEAGATPASGEVVYAGGGDLLNDIIELMRLRTVHDFSLYKIGTMSRRIERRMALAGIEARDIARYFKMLQDNQNELELLAKDLLINVTSFFRDPKVFTFLADSIIPDLLRDHPSAQPLRIWVAGCSSGEETYSLAILLIEQIEILARSRPGRAIKLQVFASDVDPDAIARAREGQYPVGIAEDVSAERLSRFFRQDEHGYRVLSELRSIVVFTVQDVLADPPFSRLDMVSCRNLLIYLQPEAQAKVVALFDFALREGGVLLLGNSETVGPADGRFEVIGKAERVYRHIGRGRPGQFAFLPSTADDRRLRSSPASGQQPIRHAALAELGRRMVLDAFAPASIMINPKFDCLYLLGPTDRYLRLAQGHPTHDLLAMARPGMRTILRKAVQQAIEQKTRVVMPGGRTEVDGRNVPFDIDVQPVAGSCSGQVGMDDLLLISFVDRARPYASDDRDLPTAPRTQELERELETTRAELQGVMRDLEVSAEEQKAINEEALSVNEEYQSTNEELLTSKEELQSLNEELTALNSQLQETLERQRTTSDDLQNVLYSTDVATLFLDAKLNIRFFTPATRQLFSLIPGDVGRPLSDLRSLAVDANLIADALNVLKQSTPIEREIRKQDGSWFVRRILPYRSHTSGIDGVVITFNDITERTLVKEALGAATNRAEMANVAKSRFLAAASHDLRQPLQTLALLHGLLVRAKSGEQVSMLLGRLEETLTAMTSLLNTLLDINQIEAGVVKADTMAFPIDDLLQELGRAFATQAESHGLQLHVVPCAAVVESDPRLLKQVLSNLLGNAIKYTKRGKILLGCRHLGDHLRIQVLDTGIGIPASELSSIFEEYHQVDRPNQARSPGMGLGLSIVHRLGVLLGHEIHVASIVARGSVFSIDVALAKAAVVASIEHEAAVVPVAELARREGAILMIEDDPILAELLQSFLEGEGHRVVAAGSGPIALDLMARGAIRPDLVLTDFNLPDAMNGLRLAQRLRELFGAALPVIVLTGDISAGSIVNVAAQNCTQLSKPVQLHELTDLIQAMLPPSCADGPHGTGADSEEGDADVVFVVDGDPVVGEAIKALLTHDGRKSRIYASGAAFLDEFRVAPRQCLLIDGTMPDIDGLELLRRLRAAGRTIPTVIMTVNSDVRMAVAAMQAGASDFIEKPIGGAELLACLQRAVDSVADSSKLSAWQAEAASRIGRLTSRQREIMTMVLDGHPSKNIAADLHISQRTVENHRAAIMHKTKSSSMPALARLALAAAGATNAPARAVQGDVVSEAADD